MLPAQYNGNGNAGFGGAIGTSNLDITENNGAINFRLTRGTTAFNDVLVIYIDSKVGGYNTTANFTDQGDVFRKAISGINGAGRSLLTFSTSPADFLPDYAVAINPMNSGSNAGLYELKENGSHSLITNITLTPSNTSNATVYNFSFSKGSIDIPGAVVNFNFVATYGNSNEAGKFNRSNEGYGAGLPTTNPGATAANFATSMSYPLVVASIPLNAFGGQVLGNSIDIRWFSVTEGNLASYILQKSNNGLNFFDLAQIAPRNLVNGAVYNYEDKKPYNGNNYYRLVSKANNGEVKYSRVIKVVYGNFDNNLTLFPNPTREILKINLTNAIRGNYTIEIFNDAGQKLIAKSIEHTGTDRILNITLPTSMKKGPYRVYISNYYEFYKGTFIVQ
jgi:hypothetical protein